VTNAFPFPFSLPRLGVIAALVRRDYLVQRSYRLAFVLDLFYGIANLLVFYFISQTFTDVTTADLSGAPSYFAFASIGIAITIVLQAASGGLAHRIREEQLTGTLEALTAQPITVPELSFGLAAFRWLRFTPARAAGKFEIEKTDAEWRAQLTPQQYEILRKEGTERPGSSPLLKEHRKGIFACAGCDLPLFSSETKFESGTGWPSFYRSF